VQFEKVTDRKVRKEIEALTKGTKSHGLLRRLACPGHGEDRRGVLPYDVITRLSDFKSNEYANLIGASTSKRRETRDRWRGASVYEDKYRDGFALECQGSTKVRIEMAHEFNP
jgi:pyruvate,water dikinase